jgi:hypothetical protein
MPALTRIFHDLLSARVCIEAERRLNSTVKAKWWTVHSRNTIAQSACCLPATLYLSARRSAPCALRWIPTSTYSASPTVETVRACTPFGPSPRPRAANYDASLAVFPRRKYATSGFSVSKDQPAGRGEEEKNGSLQLPK